MNQGLVDQEFEGPVQEDTPQSATTSPTLMASELAKRLGECAILLDIDGTLLDLAPTPREVWVPPGLARTLNGLLDKTGGALALVRGRAPAAPRPSANRYPPVLCARTVSGGRRPRRENAILRV